MSRKSWVVLALALVAGVVVGGSGVAVFLLRPGGYRQVSTTTTKLAAAAQSPAPTPVGRQTPSPMPTPFVPATPGPVGQAPPSPAPPIVAGDAPYGGNGMAFDSATGQLIAFGTAVTSNSGMTWPQPDTWSWDGTRWNKVPTTGPTPPSRTGASMAYDPVHKVVVMHGGYDAHTNWANDTWVWDGTAWAQLSPASSPPADGYVRWQPMCWESQKGTVLLVNMQGNSGGTENPIQTWSWDGSTWTLIASGPRAQLPTATACDVAGKEMVMVGYVNGQPATWTFDGSIWTQAPTSLTIATNFSMAADNGHSSVVMLGVLGDTRIWDGSGWTVRSPLHSPPTDGAMVYDPATHVVMLLTSTGLTNGDQTWSWDGTDWTRVA